MNAQLEKISDQNTVASDIVSQINDLHHQAELIASTAKEQAGKAVEIAVECGRLLTEQKKRTAHGEWIAWIKSNCRFSEDTAQNYMRLFRKVSQLAELESKSEADAKTDTVRFIDKLKAKSIRQAYIATGILPEQPVKKLGVADVGDGACGDSKPIVSHVKHIDAIVLWYRKTVENKPASRWKFIEREALINDLTPLMEIYNELVELQENMGK